jgi:hypothetical protein
MTDGFVVRKEGQGVATLPPPPIENVNTVFDVMDPVENEAIACPVSVAPPPATAGAASRVTGIWVDGSWSLVTTRSVVSCGRMFIESGVGSGKATGAEQTPRLSHKSTASRIVVPDPEFTYAVPEAGASAVNRVVSG